MKEVQTKTCAMCGQTFSRNPSYGKAKWERAKFCSNACRGEFTRALSTPNWYRR